tara:strand:- start:3739 stop:4251 length:513 start_codon:yes stop_codon:yes gene_type:complete
MTFQGSKKLKIKIYGLNFPQMSEYVNGHKYIFNSNPSTSYYTGNLSGTSLTTDVNTNDTIYLPAGRYFIQSMAPFGRNDTLEYIEWKLYSASSASGSYTQFGIRGRNNPGIRPNDSGDQEGNHAQASGIVESESDIYIQLRISSTNFSQSNIKTNSYSRYVQNMIIWKAE